MSGSKITTPASLKPVIAGLKKKGARIVFTNGCFDILHYGHVKYLEDARAKGDYLVVAINSDSSVRRIKGPHRPLIAEKERLKLVAALGCVDFTFLFKEDTPFKVIRALKPDILVKGSDWDKKNIVGAAFVRNYGGRVETVKLVKGRSTTVLIKKIVRIFSR